MPVALHARAVPVTYKTTSAFHLPDILESRVEYNIRLLESRLNFCIQIPFEKDGEREREKEDEVLRRGKFYLKKI